MRLIELLEDDAQSYKLPVSPLISPSDMLDISNEWISYNGTHDWLRMYVDEINGLHDHGGDIYRVIFLSDINDFDPNDLGEHWSTDSSQLDDAFDQLQAMADPQHEMTAYLIIATIKPHSITVPVGTVIGEPTEWEVNLISPSAIIDYELIKW